MMEAPCCSCTVESLNMRLSGETTVSEFRQPCTTPLVCSIVRPRAAGTIALATQRALRWIQWYRPPFAHRTQSCRQSRLVSICCSEAGNKGRDYR